MTIEKRKVMNFAKSQTCFLSMYFSTQTLLLFFIFISISWNGYNTYQYRVVVERQRKLENLLTEFFPTSSSLPLVQSQSITIEQWISKISQFIQRLTLKEPTDDKPSSVRISYCA